MINTNELRIGNFIEWKHEFVKVTGVLKGGIHSEEDSVRLDGVVKPVANPQFVIESKLIPLNQIYPIPMKIGILMRCNFEYNPNENLLTLRNTDFCIKTTLDGKFYRFDKEREFMIDPEIKSLHQLQNLYFALEEEEIVFD